MKRGGLITFHGPGQLVVYPIFNLRALRVSGSAVGAKRYVSLLESLIARLASDHFGLNNVGTTQHPGFNC